MKIDTTRTTAILGLPFCLLLQSGLVPAADITEVESNNTIDTAQNIDNDFSVGANIDIQDSETRPWVSISASGDGTQDYYAFEVPAAGVTGLFDIDYGYHAGGSVDTELCLYATDGTFLAGNDDSGISLGAGGSIHSWDPGMEHVFAAPGTYVIGVGEYNAFCNPGGIGGNAPDSGDTYELQVSLSQHGLDSDGDGVTDAEDCNQYSDLNPTVVFEGCDAGVANTLFANGCTITDLIQACADDAGNHGLFSNCVAGVTKDLKKSGDIPASGKGMIQSCAARSDIGK
ncbi:MAG: DVUA0089 family protein [Gammaproteobacteria bacterium]|jgi:hypothetical protein